MKRNTPEGSHRGVITPALHWCASGSAGAAQACGLLQARAEVRANTGTVIGQQNRPASAGPVLPVKGGKRLQFITRLREMDHADIRVFHTPGNQPAGVAG